MDESMHDMLADDQPLEPDFPVEPAVPPDGELRLLPEKDHIHIDCHQGSWYVTNTMTLEQRLLESGPWTVESDDEGYCVLLYHGDLPDVAPIVISAEMQKNIWVKPCGELIHVQAFSDQPDK